MESVRRDPSRGAGHVQAHHRGDRGGSRDPSGGVQRVQGERRRRLMRPGAREDAWWPWAPPRSGCWRRSTQGRALEGRLPAHSRAPPRVFITPGYAFRAVDALVTNFHLPHSSLLALVMAFAGVDGIRAAYACAVREGYRFFSFGDAMLMDCHTDGSLVTSAGRHGLSRLPLHPRGHGRWSPRGTPGNAARQRPHALLHARRHQGHGEGDASGPSGRHRRTDRAGQHVPLGPAPRERHRGRAGRSSPVRRLGRPHAHG